MAFLAQNFFSVEVGDFAHFAGIVGAGSQTEQANQDPGSQTEPAAPSVSLYFRVGYQNAILSAVLMPRGFYFPSLGHGPKFRVLSRSSRVDPHVSHNGS
jgi:hypothetical protein